MIQELWNYITGYSTNNLIMSQSVEIKDVFSWFIMLVFVLIGILNLVYIHWGPAVLYLALSLFYCPTLGEYVKAK